MEDTGMRVNERKISIQEMLNAHYEGRLLEIVGCSTSSFIQPISRVTYRDQRIRLNTNNSSPYVSYLNNLLTDIMMGPESHKWVHSLE